MDDFEAESQERIKDPKRVIVFQYSVGPPRHLEDPRYYDDPLVESVVEAALEDYSEITRDGNTPEEQLLLRSIVKTVNKKIPVTDSRMALHVNYDSTRVSRGVLPGVSNCQEHSVVTLAAAEKLFKENNLPFNGVLFQCAPEKGKGGHSAVFDPNLGLIADASYHDGSVMTPTEFLSNYPHLVQFRYGRYDPLKVDTDEYLEMEWVPFSLTDETSWPEYEKTEPTFLESVK